MIKLDMLRYFVAVAETGSLAAGAARVGRSVSAVSMTLKQLQDIVGAPLFVSDRKAQLTVLGAYTLDQARAALAHFDQTQRAIMRFAQTGGGLIRMACVPSVAGVILPAVLRAFHDIHPDVQVDLRDMESVAVIQGVLDGAFDVGIASAPQGILKSSRVHLCDDPFGVICHRDHPLAHRKGGVTWADVRDLDLIANPLTAGLGIGDVYDGPHVTKLSAHNTLSLLSMVQEGLGAAILPRLVSHLAWGDVCFVPINDSRAHRRIDVFTSDQQAKSSVIAGLVAIIIEESQWGSRIG